VPIPLTGPQFNAIVTAAAILYPGDRDAFVAAVAAELARAPIGDGSVGRAIRAVQGRFQHPEPEPTSASRWERDNPRFDRASKRAY
jgi:hypothetical protein